MSDPRPDAVQRFFGAGLLAVGVLMIVLCGGCGAVFLLYFLFHGVAHPNDMPLTLIPLVVGGVPALIGFGLFAAGRALRRAPKPPPSALPPG